MYEGNTNYLISGGSNNGSKNEVYFLFINYCYVDVLLFLCICRSRTKSGDTYF